MKTNGVMMKKMSIKEYAVKHKLSIFNVMKMIKENRLKTQIDNENGREITYILLDEITEKEVENGIIPFKARESTTVIEELNNLKNEISSLRDEIEILKKSLH